MFLAIVGFAIANLRERLIELFVGGPGRGQYSGDPVDYILDEGLLGIAALAILGFILLTIGFSYLSWRMHSYRVTAESVEMRRGIVFRTHRQAKIDRIQGVEINRPFLARLFGAAKLDVSVAGQDGKVSLEYLRSAQADELRADILTLASGRSLDGSAAVATATSTGTDGVGSRVAGVVSSRVDDLLSREADNGLADWRTAVRVPTGRVIASTIVSWTTVIVIVLAIVLTIVTLRGAGWALFTLIPAAIGFGSYYWGAITRSLKYSIAQTPSGIRVASGLLSTVSETVAPGRIHAVEVIQPLLWRPFGWWTVRITKAGVSLEDQMKATSNVLPVGRLEDVDAVLRLLLRDGHGRAVASVLPGVMSDPAAQGLQISPRRAVWLSPFAWKRTGVAIADGAVVVRRGVIWRRLVVVPLVRVQSLEVTQGPIDRWFSLATATLHTVPGPIVATVTQVDVRTCEQLFLRVIGRTVEQMHSDGGERWDAEGRGAR
ncbi:MAG: PH domain-containing protein [Mycetocola sp.]